MAQYKAATQRRGAGRLQGAALCDKAESAETRELHQVNQRVPKQAVSSPAIYESRGGTVARAAGPVEQLQAVRLDER